jgi:DNA-binding transcriptional regulator YiaG
VVISKARIALASTLDGSYIARFDSALYIVVQITAIKQFYTFIGVVLRMNRETFSKIRHYLGKTQNQLAQLLCTSPKAVQSFEQGWRNIPVHAERQLLFLLAMKDSKGKKKTKPCWEITKCSSANRQSCPVQEFHAGHFCWLINGTLCAGKAQKSWQQKMNLCSECQVFQSMLPFLNKGDNPGGRGKSNPLD